MCTCPVDGFLCRQQFVSVAPTLNKRQVASESGSNFISFFVFFLNFLLYSVQSVSYTLKTFVVQDVPPRYTWRVKLTFATSCRCSTSLTLISLADYVNFICGLSIANEADGPDAPLYASCDHSFGM